MRGVSRQASPLGSHHVDVGLEVGDGGVGARLAARNSRVALDERRHLASFELNAEAQRRHVEQQQVSALAGRQVRTAAHAACRQDAALVYLKEVV